MRKRAFYFTLWRLEFTKNEIGSGTAEGRVQEIPPRFWGTYRSLVNSEGTFSLRLSRTRKKRFKYINIKGNLLLKTNKTDKTNNNK